MKKVYFSGSIRGGRADVDLYHDVIEHIQKTDIVLTEQVGDASHDVTEKEFSREEKIYLKDTKWLRECDLVIAECTCPSLGVGYELAYAEKYNKPVYVFYRPSQTNLSAMIKGDAYFHVIPYETKEEIIAQITVLLEA
ncbi:MAG: nucleoside 2-deoxyribosyltransferase [Solobacterium sp.]|nr:nucleoside 2-deoxyribosyltransferase [Solobacterium sp.]